MRKPLTTRQWITTYLIAYQWFYRFSFERGNVVPYLVVKGAQSKSGRTKQSNRHTDTTPTAEREVRHAHFFVGKQTRRQLIAQRRCCQSNGLDEWHCKVCLGAVQCWCGGYVDMCGVIGVSYNSYGRPATGSPGPALLLQLRLPGRL